MAGARFLDHALFAELTLAAGVSPRQRRHHNLHEMSEPCHRLLVGLQPDTYIPPHRHLSADKAETLIALQGRFGLLLFSELGELEATRVLQAGGECSGVDLAPGQFHALVVLSPDACCSSARPAPTGHWAMENSPAGRMPRALRKRPVTATGCVPASTIKPPAKRSSAQISAQLASPSQRNALARA